MDGDSGAANAHSNTGDHNDAEDSDDGGTNDDGDGGDEGTDNSSTHDEGDSGTAQPAERGPLPESENDLLPFVAPQLLYYNGCNRPSWFEGSKDVPSGSAAVLRDASGSAEYYRSLAGELRLSGYYLDIPTVDGQPRRAQISCWRMT